MLYSSDLTSARWEYVKPIFAGGRFRWRFHIAKHTPYAILNALFYLTKSGVQWRMLPKSYPPWQTVYYHFRR